MTRASSRATSRKRLVVPTDFSASATRAWLSAIERPADAIGDAARAARAAGGRRKAASAATPRCSSTGCSTWPASTTSTPPYEIRFGDPAQVVLDYLAEVDATGVITGQHGRGRLMRQVMLGGLSLRLLREAPCPVVVQP